MGFIKQLTGDRQKLLTPTRSRALWAEVFGTDKESGSFRQGEQPRSRPVPGGSYGRSIAGESNSYVRLLQAMRSMAPGGWSDDRYEESRHFTGIPYICAHRTGEQMAQAEFQVYEKDDNHQDGKKPVSKRSNPEAYGLVELLEKPNNDDSFGDLMYRWNQQMDLTGSALTWMVPNQLRNRNPDPRYRNAGTPYELYCIPTATAIPQPAVNPDYPDGYYRIQPLYPYGPFSSYPTPNSAVGAPIPAQWMLRYQFPHPLLRYDGYSPLTALRLHIDSLESVDRSRWYNMKRVFNPSAVLNMENVEGLDGLPEEEILRIKAEFENTFQGPENTGHLFVAAPGTRLDPWGTSPKEMDYGSSWDQLVSFIMAGFGITKPAAGMIDDASYATLFATLKQFYLLTLQPKCRRIAAKITKHLAPFFGENLIVEIRCPKIDDHEIAFQKVDKGISGRCLTKNEARKLMDFPITKEAWGDEIVGTETPPPMMPGMEGAMGAGMAPGQPMPAPVDTPFGLNPQGQTPQEGQQETAMDQDKGVIAGRPNPMSLNVGSSGPRKMLSKSLWRQLRGYRQMNGHHRNGHS